MCSIENALRVDRNAYICSCSVPANVCNSDRESAADGPKEERSTKSLPQGQRYHTIHRVPLGEHDHDASQSYTILAFYGTHMLDYAADLLRL